VHITDIYLFTFSLTCLTFHFLASYSLAAVQVFHRSSLTSSHLHSWRSTHLGTRKHG